MYRWNERTIGSETKIHRKRRRNRRRRRRTRRRT